MDLYYYWPVFFPVIVGSVAMGWLLVSYYRLLQNQHLLAEVFKQVIPVCITNTNHEIITANDSYWVVFGLPDDKNKPIKCFEHRPGKSCHTENCPLTQILDGQSEFICKPQKEHNGEMQYYIVTARPYYGRGRKIIGIIESFQEITAIKKLEEEKEQLITELQESLRKVKLLRGLIPICASCKRVRDDQGFWGQVEAYVARHSEAEFSHGICPECVRELYP